MKIEILRGKNIVVPILTLFIHLSAHATPQPQGQFKKNKNCYIHTKATTKARDVQEKTLSFDFKTKAECVKMRKILSDNFDPANIVKSEARMDWKGK